MIAAGVVAFGGLLLSAALCLLRLLRPGSLADRIVALDALVVVIVCGLAVLAATTDEGTYLDVMVAAALLGFAGAVTASRYIGEGGG